MSDRGGTLALRLIVAVTIAALTVLPVTVATADELVTVAGGFSATLPPTPSANVVVPFTLVGAGTAPITTEILFITRDKVQLADAKVTASADVGKRLITIAVGEGALERAGTYVATLRLTRGTATQVLDVNVVRPPAGLTVPATVKVKKTVLLPELGWVDRNIFGGLHAVDAPALFIPVGPDGRLSRLSAGQTEAANGGIRLHVRCAMPPDEKRCTLDGEGETVLGSPVGPNGSVDVGYELYGRFPLGTATRTVTLRSGELAAPQTLTFEVRTRRHQGLIVVVVALGLMAGWLLREVIATVIRRLGAYDERDELLRRLTAIRAGYADAGLQRDLDLLITRLRNTSLSSLGTEVPAVRAEAAKRLEPIHAAIATARTRYEELRPVLGSRWHVPTPVKGPLDEARGGLKRLGRLIDAKNATEASALMAELNTRLLPALSEGAEAWLVAYSARLGDLIAALEGNSKPAKDAVTHAKAEIHTEAAEITVWLQRVDLAILGWRTVATALATAAEEWSESGAAIKAQLVQDGDADPARTITALLPDVLELSKNESLGDSTAAPGRGVGGTDNVPSTPELPVLPPPTEELLRQAPARIFTGVTRNLALTVRFLILMVLLVLLALGLFADSWIGTAKDMITLLFWAFATDVTIEAVTTSAAGLTKPAVR